MSVDKQFMDTQPEMSVVTDDVILPVAESSVLERTKERYAAMSPNQKRDFWLAVSSTLAGVALTTGAFVIEKRNPSSKLPNKLRAAGYAFDYADGFFAKRSATAVDDGAATELGAIADPLADKFNNTLNEVALVQNGKLSMADLAIRATRDTGVTFARRLVTKQSKGRVDVKANKFGKMNTVVRDGVNLFASTQVAANYPRINRGLQTGANIYSVASGLYTVRRLMYASRKNS